MTSPPPSKNGNGDSSFAVGSSMEGQDKTMSVKHSHNGDATDDSRVSAEVGLRSCAGFGWVTFNHQRSSGASISNSPLATAVLDNRVPLLRCMGFQSGLQGSDTFAYHAAMASTSAAIDRGNGSISFTGGRNADTPSGFFETPSSFFSPVADETWGTFCAGRLSILSAPVREKHAWLSSESPTDSTTASLSSPWAQCHMRCTGISIRLDSIDETPKERADESAIAAPPAVASVATSARSSSASAAEHGESAPQSVTPQEFVEDVARTAYRATSKVTGRAIHILATAGAVAQEIGPVEFATNTANTAGKIYDKAGQVVRRSVTMLENIARAPRRLIRGEDPWPPARDK